MEQVSNPEELLDLETDNEETEEMNLCGWTHLPPATM